jgi:hypothetical protein
MLAPIDRTNKVPWQLTVAANWGRASGNEPGFGQSPSRLTSIIQRRATARACRFAANRRLNRARRGWVIEARCSVA